MQILTFMLLQRRSEAEFPIEAIFSLSSLGFFIGIVFLLSIGLFIYRYRQRQKRCKQFQMFAAQNGWTYVFGAGLNSFPNANLYSIFSSGHSKEILNLMHKPTETGERVIVFDYKYVTGAGRTSSTHKKTVVALFSPRLELPFFALYPESFLSFVGELVGYNDIDFTSHPHFSSRYKLSGQNETHIRQTFYPVLNYLDQMPTVNIDGGGNYVFVYVPNDEARLENFHSFINERRNFLNLFRR